MKAIVKTKKEPGFEYQDVPVPEVGKKDVLVKIKAAAICGSDLKIYKWIPWCENVIKSLPFIPGHECAGEVVEVGKEVKRIKVGDKVAAETHIPCGVCWQCRHNRPHTCERMELFGHTINGCFAEYSLIPEVSTRKIAEEIPFEQGCLLEPMGIPLRAVERGEVEGDAVVVIGCGPIGQFAIAFSRIMGAEIIIGIDINERRLGIARKMGATHLINPEKDSVVKKVKSLTKDYGGRAGVIIEASGSVKATRDAFDYLRVGGKFVILGQTDGPLPLNPSVDIVFKEAEIIGFFGRRIWDTWEKTEGFLTSGKINPQPVVTHRFPLSEFKPAFEKALSGEGCKVLLIPC
jgi:threonine 3-dehydrogenase